MALVADLAALARRLPVNGAFEHHCRVLIETAQLGLGPDLRSKAIRAAVKNLRQVRKRRADSMTATELRCLVAGAFQVGILYGANQKSAAYRMLRAALTRRVVADHEDVLRKTARKKASHAGRDRSVVHNAGAPEEGPGDLEAGHVAGARR